MGADFGEYCCECPLPGLFDFDEGDDENDEDEEDEDKLTLLLGTDDDTGEIESSSIERHREEVGTSLPAAPLFPVKLAAAAAAATLLMNIETTLLLGFAALAAR